MNSWLGDPTNDAMAALAIVAVTLVPVLARMAAVHARSRRGGGENRSRLLKAEGQEAGSLLGALEERDRQARRRQEIAAVRAARRAAVRRRRAAVIVLLVVCVLLLGVSFFARYPWWFCLLPLAALVVLLVEGAVSSAKTRRFERRVRSDERSARRSRAAARAESSVTVPVGSPVTVLGKPPVTVPGQSQAQDPISLPIRSVRQVARAVPLTGQERSRVFADVTPSVQLPIPDGGATVPDRRARVRDGRASRPGMTDACTNDMSDMPDRSDMSDGRVTSDGGIVSDGRGSRDESLSSDLSAILSRRNS